MSHIDTKDIAAYVSGRMADTDCMRVERHLAGCLECAKRVKAHYHIKDNFDQAWVSWTKPLRTEAVLAERIGLSLSQILFNPKYAEHRGRMESWLKKLQAKAGIAWCATVDTSRQAAKVLKNDLNLLFLQEPPTWLRTAAVQPVEVRTRGATLTSGSPPKTGVSIADEGLVKVNFSDGPGGSITIRVESVTLAEPLPLVILIPKAGEKIFISVFKKTRKGFLAEFKDMPKAEYTLALEG